MQRPFLRLHRPDIALSVVICVTGWRCPSSVASFGIGNSSVRKIRRGSAHYSTLVQDPESSRITTFKSVLVCGDGDLSFSARLAPELHQRGISLTATVLEDEDVHNLVYSDSNRYVKHIQSFYSHTVLFGIDATRLEHQFPSSAFDLIQFNFPHWRGKANNRRNRELLDAFLKSASQILTRTGQVHVPLCEGQGGTTAATPEEWRQSWMAALYAAEHRLLLRRVDSYKPLYNLSSHRGADRPFRVGDEPELYQFGFSNGESVARKLQMCCRHELHFKLSKNDPIGGGFTRDGLIEGDDILEIARQIVPEGVRVEVPIRRLLSPEELNQDTESTKEDDVVVFLIVYCGESVPLTRSSADSFRASLESEIEQFVPLRASRAGRLVSRPFPYSLLQQLIDEHVQ